VPSSKGESPEPRGRLGAQLRAVQAEGDKSPKQRYSCYVSASLTEGGEMVLQVNGAAEYLDGSRVGAVLEGDDIPQKLANDVRKALQAVLDEGHESLKEEVDRETAFAIDNERLRGTRAAILAGTFGGGEEE
jgi:hypothetical protein